MTSLHSFAAALALTLALAACGPTQPKPDQPPQSAGDRFCADVDIAEVGISVLQGLGYVPAKYSADIARLESAADAYCAASPRPADVPSAVLTGLQGLAKQIAAEQAAKQGTGKQ